LKLLTEDNVTLGIYWHTQTGPITGFIVGSFGYSAISLYGAEAAGCAFVLTLLLYHLVREPHLRLASRRLVFDEQLTRRELVSRSQLRNPS
jgi:hypothetical protein